MANLNFNDPIVKAAETVKQSTPCPEHGEMPNYIATQTTKGANVKWTFCCDKQKELVVAKFKDEMTKNVKKAASTAITDAIKQSTKSLL